MSVTVPTGFNVTVRAGEVIVEDYVYGGIKMIQTPSPLPSDSQIQSIVDMVVQRFVCDRKSVRQSQMSPYRNPRIMEAIKSSYRFRGVEELYDELRNDRISKLPTAPSLNEDCMKPLGALFGTKYEQEMGYTKGFVTGNYRGQPWIPNAASRCSSLPYAKCRPATPPPLPMCTYMSWAAVRDSVKGTIMGMLRSGEIRIGKE